MADRNNFKKLQTWAALIQRRTKNSESEATAHDMGIAAMSSRKQGWGIVLPGPLNIILDIVRTFMAKNIQL